MDYQYLTTLTKFILKLCPIVSLLQLKILFPTECKSELSDYLVASGNTSDGYVFAAPYSISGWLSGNIPANQDDFVLKASITDPPLLLARILNTKLKAEGIKISGNPTTIRLVKNYSAENIVPIIRNKLSETS